MSSLPFSFLLSQLGFLLPLLAVATIGSLIALVRWAKHPQVSALMLASLMAIAAVAVVQSVGTFLVLQQRTSGSGNFALLGVLSLVYTAVRTGAWMAILTALFGWRADPPNLPPTARAGFQFSIRSLMILTTIVAVLCVLLRWLVALVGDSMMYLLQFVDEIPLVTCWLLGLRLAIVRWPKHPAVSLAALLGIGMALAVFCLGVVNFLVMVSGTVSRHPLISSATSLSFSLLSTIGWSFTLTAVFGWREEANVVGTLRVP